MTVCRSAAPIRPKQAASLPPQLSQRPDIEQRRRVRTSASQGFSPSSFARYRVVKLSTTGGHMDRVVMRQSCVGLGSLALVCLALAGCGDGLKRYRVKGTVTFE